MDNIATEYGYNIRTVSGEYDLSFGSWDADLIGHGTHVSGIVGAVGNNGLGITGVNWNVKIIPVRVYDTTNDYETINYEIRALNYIASLLSKNPSMKLAAVNLSLGAALPITPSEIQNDVYYMAYHALDSLNRTLIVVSAGNKGVEVGAPTLFDEPVGDNGFKKGQYYYPASFIGLNNLIVVGAIASDDTAPDFTSWGEKVDIAAPGVAILSTYSAMAESGQATAMYITVSGTSQAAPYVTGAAALLMSAYPDATPEQIKSALLDGANRDKNPLVYPYAGYVKRYVDMGTKEVDSLIEAGRVPIASRDELIAKVTLTYEEKYAPYKQFDGNGRVSRTGLLDVKAAYDLLEQRSHGSGSSSGCYAGLPAVIAILAGGFILMRKW